jgi:hypothetical protein
MRSRDVVGILAVHGREDVNYAKLDLQLLAEVALPWPGSAS